MDEDDQKLRVRLVGRDGRRRYDPTSRERLVAACLEPGVSVSRLALDMGSCQPRAKMDSKGQASPSCAAVAAIDVYSGSGELGLQPANATIRPATSWSSSTATLADLIDL